MTENEGTIKELNEARALTRATNALTQLQIKHLYGWFFGCFPHMDITTLKTEVDFDNHHITYICKPKKKKKGQLKKKMKPDVFEANINTLAAWVRWLLGPDWGITFEGKVVRGGPTPRHSNAAVEKEVWEIDKKFNNE